MEKKIKTQKGVVQIPILIIAIIVAIVSTVGVTVVLHKQKKPSIETANISQIFKETEEIQPKESTAEQEPKESQMNRELEEEKIITNLPKKEKVSEYERKPEPESQLETQSSEQRDRDVSPIQEKHQVSKGTTREAPSGNSIEEDGKKEAKARQEKELASPETSVITAIVNYVIDGDTIVLTDGERVRYLGINAPEKGQPYSTEATRANERLVAGKKIKLEFDVQTRDRYGRLLAYVWVGKTMVNEELVKEGYAVSETIQPNVKYQDLIVEAQKEARKSCRGLWEGICNPQVNKSCIRIININADAPGNDNYNKNGEWIEIKNFCSNPISMNEWLIKDNSASNRYQFGSFTLDGGNSVIIYSGYGTDTQEKLYWANYQHNKYAIWNNTGDHAFLYDAQGTLVDDYQY